ncbi:uncharacterized protein DUF748 [Halospina denitrificans]|uniref:Uncharacterized protein DUF748 n=1 Tax=Halospina denitrificans TaxID=332522 RepID=A0A4R7JW70_9GAMM|nr:DUF748 domain-containing protein [Halospina denitrificans]TDT41693.1 uncharacterized protein DUF748 [Halospina denitrificans]
MLSGTNHSNGKWRALMDNGSLSQFGCYLRTRWINPRRIRFWVLVLVLVYTLLGFLGLPWLVEYFAVKTAREDFGRELRIEAVHSNPYTLTLQIDGAVLDDKGDRQLLAWKQLFVDLSWSSIVNMAWTLETIRLEGPVIQEERFASGETRLSRLFTGSSDKGAEEEPESSGKASEEEESGSLPALRIDDLRVEGGILRFADNLEGGAGAEGDQTNQVTLALQEFGLSMDQFSLQEGARFPISMGGQLAGGGELAFDGTLQILPSFALQGEAGIDELALVQAEPYLRQSAAVRIDSGALNLSGKIRTEAEEPFAFRGSAGIDALSIGDGSDDDALIGWQSLRTEQLDLRVGDSQLDTAPITVDGLSGRVVINEDRTTNFGQLMVENRSPDAKEEGDDTESEEDADPFGITIEGIELTEGSLKFADNSLPLPFATSIHTLNGQISTLSTSSAQAAEVNLEGQVADYGLARIGGTIHAWDPMRETDLGLTFRNLQIPEYSPYTVQFAGRKIAGGTMDLDLDYVVKDRQLDGSNNLVLHDLKLGEKMASSDAMDLPLDLAIALLKDSDGVIDLDLPVSGNVGEPDFDFGQVIRQALNKTLTSVVQAPFRFLASLVGADSEDLGRVEFPAGRGDLTPPQRERVAKLREALNERPELILELAGPFNPSTDGPSLQQGKAVGALEQRLAEADREVTDPSLTAASSQDAVETLFTTHYPDTDLETVRARFTGAQDESSEEDGFDVLSYRNHLAERVVAAQSVTDADLKALADARAEAVREALVDEGVENSISADRVRLLEAAEVDSGEGEPVTMEVGVAAG